MNRTDATTVLGLAAAIVGDAWGIVLVADGRLLALLPLAITIALTVRLADNLYRSRRLARAAADADARFTAITVVAHDTGLSWRTVSVELDKEV